MLEPSKQMTLNSRPLKVSNCYTQVTSRCRIQSYHPNWVYIQQGFIMYLLCRNKIMDYQVWRDYFNVNTISYEEAGLMLKSLWHETSSTQSELNVFCMFKVCDAKKAKAFLDAPELIQQRTKAGVIEKEHHFIDEIPSFIRH